MENVNVDNRIELDQAPDIESQKLSIEKQKLEIELQKLKLERSKLGWTSISAIIPIIALIGTIVYGIYTQKEDEKSKFKLKAAEIMFNSADGYEAKINAEILKQLFPDKIPADFSNTFNPDLTGAYDSYLINSKKDLLKLIALNPKNANDIISFWKKLFPDDKWLDNLSKTKSN